MFENNENKNFPSGSSENSPAENMMKKPESFEEDNTSKPLEPVTAEPPQNQSGQQTEPVAAQPPKGENHAAPVASGWDNAPQKPQDAQGENGVNSQVYSYIEDWRRASAEPPKAPEQAEPQNIRQETPSTVMSQRKEVYGSLAGGDVWQPVPPKTEEPPAVAENTGPAANENADWYAYASPQAQHQPENVVGKFAIPVAGGESRKKGAGKFMAVLMAVFVFSVAALAGVQVYDRILETPLPNESTGSTAPEKSGPMPGLTLNDRPEEQVKPAGAVMSSSEVVKTIKSSVVGISNYYVQNSFTPDSEGSGIIFSADGYIVTNAHVIADAKILTVSLENGDTYPATIIGSDTRTDLAVIKINAENLPYAEFGNSDQVEVGDPVLAIGNPNGMELAGSVTKGIISGLNRFGNLSSYGTSYIQTDAAINPGNSGGALVNEYAQVIGINSAKLVATEFEGIGFAIPINEVLPVITDLVKNGRVTGRAELGITGQMVDEALAEANGTPMGIGIKSIKPESDLLVKGVEVGDIITKVNGQDIEDFSSLSGVIASCKPGDTITLTIYRKDNYGNEKTFEVEIALMEMVE